MAKRHRYKVQIPGRYPTVLLLTEDTAKEKYPDAVRLDAQDTTDAPTEGEGQDDGGQKQAEQPQNKAAPDPQNKAAGN